MEGWGREGRRRPAAGLHVTSHQRAGSFQASRQQKQEQCCGQPGEEQGGREPGGSKGWGSCFYRLNLEGLRFWFRCEIDL